jgi:hypothetical protein
LTTILFSHLEPLAIKTDIFSRLRIPKYENISTNVAAATAGTAIVYNGVDGKLFYNPNLMAAGFGGGTSNGYFAQLNAGLNLTHNDFIVTV